MTHMLAKNDSSLAFSIYLENVIDLKRYPWIRRGPLSRVSDELIERAATLMPLSAKLSYAQHPRKDFGRLPPSQQSIVDEIEDFYEQECRFFAHDLKTAFDFYQEVSNDLGGEMVTCIQEATNVEWPFEEIWITPTLFQGGTVHDHIVFMGLLDQDRGPKGYIPGIVHEFVHVNTAEVNKPLRESLKLPTDSIEVATVLTTNMAIRKINVAKVGLELRSNNFSYYYRPFMEKYVGDLLKLVPQSSGYTDLVIRVDQFFMEHDYQGYFKQHGI